MLIALRMTIVMTLLTGALYPALVTGIVRAVFPRQANGSLIEANGKVIGSELIGQSFTKPKYFHGRPSAAGDKGYDAANSSGANLGPTNPKLLERMKADADAFRKDNPTYLATLPADIVTASASGLDPHISPASAHAQEVRVAIARHMDVAQLHKLIDAHVEPRTFGVLGEPRVNVLQLNLALDKML